MKRIVACTVLSLIICLSSYAEESSNNLPQYTPQALPSGSLSSVGSDSMGDLVRLWVEEFKSFQPKVALQVVARGSATAPAALIEGTADLGPMSRPMKDAEREEFIAAYGFEPTQIRTAYAAVAVYMPSAAPVNSLSVSQLEKIFTSDKEMTWGDLGVTGNYSKTPVMIFGLKAQPYLSSYFKQRVLRQNEFSKSLMSTVDNDSLYKAVLMNKGAIGFGHPTLNPADLPEGVKQVRVSKATGDTAFVPTLKAIKTGKYPLSRSLNIYVARQPGEAVDPVLKDFLSYVLSQQGQEVVKSQGLIPLNLDVVNTERRKLN